MAVEPHHYRTVGHYSKKSKKLHATTTKIRDLKEQMRIELLKAKGFWEH